MATPQLSKMGNTECHRLVEIQISAYQKPLFGEHTLLYVSPTKMLKANIVIVRDANRNYLRVSDSRRSAGVSLPTYLYGSSRILRDSMTPHGKGKRSQYWNYSRLAFKLKTVTKPVSIEAFLDCADCLENNLGVPSHITQKLTIHAGTTELFELNAPKDKSKAKVVAYPREIMNMFDDLAAANCFIGCSDPKIENFTAKRIRKLYKSHFVKKKDRSVKETETTVDVVNDADGVLPFTHVEGIPFTKEQMLTYITSKENVENFMVLRGIPFSLYSLRSLLFKG